MNGTMTSDQAMACLNRMTTKSDLGTKNRPLFRGLFFCLEQVTRPESLGMPFGTRLFRCHIDLSAS
jgi:hypothetical protein